MVLQRANLCLSNELVDVVLYSKESLFPKSSRKDLTAVGFHVPMLMLDCFSLTPTGSIVNVESLHIPS